MRDRTLSILIGLATALSLGHHIDPVVRGNHVGWPVTEHATVFTYSLGVYPLILLGLILYHTKRVGPGYWALLSGTGIIVLVAVHVGSTVVEPPADIIDPYEAPFVGWFAFAWLVGLIAVLILNFVYEAYAWLRIRAPASVRSPG